MSLAEIPSMVQEEASRPQFTPTGSNTSPQEAMQCDHGILDKRRPQQYAFRLILSPHQLRTNKNQSGRPEEIDKSTNSAKTYSHRRRHTRHISMGCWSARKAQRLNKRLMFGRGRRIAKSLRPGMKGSLDFKPCTTLDQRRGSAEWCTTLRTCTMGPIVECGFCSAWLKETMCESTAFLPPTLAAESRQSVVYLCLSSQSIACAWITCFG